MMAKRVKKMLDRLFKKKKIPYEVKNELLLLYELGVEVDELEYLMSIKLKR